MFVCVYICAYVCVCACIFGQKGIFVGENLNATLVFRRFVTTVSKQRQISCDEHAPLQ